MGEHGFIQRGFNRRRKFKKRKTSLWEGLIALSLRTGRSARQPVIGVRPNRCLREYYNKRKTMFQIKVDDSGVVKLLGELKQRTSNLNPTMQVIGELVKTSVKRNFEVGGRYSMEGSWAGGSKTWLPLSAATLFSGRKSKYITRKGSYRKGVEEKLKKLEFFKKNKLLQIFN
ncbi:MAG: hypothetical protein HS127_07550 [Planctomycetia bacterium]|uniref:Uncharacterized protein n=2 Tax=Kuenenia stuttgartiensis TaxID=174633 RepID=Q1Q3C1_KUEST|nr:hypothetical protein [Planctomycetia bacterium]CAJ74520.1 unknown protein [Candidatus Kuenenia stuttgartiensis]